MDQTKELYLAVRLPGRTDLTTLRYKAKDGESVQALMIRVANDITDGEIVDMGLFKVNRPKPSAEEQALIDQAVAAI